MKRLITITGSNGSLGFELIKKFSNSKYKLLLHLRKPNIKIDRLIKKNKIENIVKIVYGDIRSISTIKKLSKLIKLYDNNILINNCGIYLNKSFLKTTEKEIKDLFEINFFSNIFLLKSIINIKFKSLFIININSVAGVNGALNESIYSSTKHALKGFYESLELETKNNIRYLNIFLGAFKSRITKKRKNFPKLMNPAELAEIISKNLNEYTSCSMNKVFIKRRIY